MRRLIVDVHRPLGLAFSAHHFERAHAELAHVAEVHRWAWSDAGGLPGGGHRSASREMQRSIGELQHEHVVQAAGIHTGFVLLDNFIALALVFERGARDRLEALDRLFAAVDWHDLKAAPF